MRGAIGILSGVILKALRICVKIEVLMNRHIEIGLNGIELKFIGLDGQARYKVPWSKELQTMREIIEHERPDLLGLYDSSNPTGKWNPLGKACD